MYFSIKIYIVCSYSFELSQKTVPTTFILNYYRLICPYLEAIEKVRVFLFNAFLHQNIYGMYILFRTVSDNSTYNIYSKLLPHMSAYLRAIEKAYSDIKAK